MKNPHLDRLIPAIRAFGERSFQELIRPLLANLRAGARTAFFLRVDAKSWEISSGLLIALIVTLIVLGVALNRTFYSGAVEFNWSELRTLWNDVPVILLVGWLAARSGARRISVIAVPIAVFAALASVDVVTTIIFHLGKLLGPRREYQLSWFVYVGYYVWFVALVAVFVRRTARLSMSHLSLVILPVLFLSAYSFREPPPELWYSAPGPSADAADTRRESPVSEEMLYLQPKLAESSINSLARQRRGVADVYFVGFAPYAGQDVFLKESEVIRNLMDDRFDTYGRSLLFVNNAKTLRQYPLATVTNLRAAIQRVGRVMDKNEDVLVLYLTSHGSQTHKLAARFWPLQLQELDPATVKQLLDEADIRWRVVIVSACYAGGFIEPLRGPETLVMTAADATHTSFGCGNDSDFTYFSKALFDEELRQTFSFEQAFTRAVETIRTREQAEQQDRSNPQMAMGEAIRQKLAEIERRLASDQLAETKRRR